MIIAYLIIIDDYAAIEELNQEGIYKHLGVDETDGIQHSKIKESEIDFKN